MVDTNILFSAFALRGGGSSRLFRIIRREYHLLVPEFSIVELEDLYRRELPALQVRLSQSLRAWRRSGDVLVVRTRDIPTPEIADPKDKPILQAALSAKPDFFVSNDIKHFHTPAIKLVLRVVTVSEMLRLLGR